MKFLVTIFFILMISNSMNAQKLLVHHYDENGAEIQIDTFRVGDYIVVGHTKNRKNPHYFEGKITGLYEDKGVVRIFDYARSTRVMPIVGKKIPLEEIIGVARPETEEMKGRQNKAIAATAVSMIGSAIGGDVGNAVVVGGVASNVAFDFTSRKRVDKQRIKCEISEY